jgi:hypothetical protein
LYPQLEGGDTKFFQITNFFTHALKSANLIVLEGKFSDMTLVNHKIVVTWQRHIIVLPEVLRGDILTIFDHDHRLIEFCLVDQTGEGVGDAHFASLVERRK